jgi:NTP pyrophosphatase (non-canonical NTP hydrolase)
MQTPSERSLIELRDQIRDFVRERDWNQFHTPKNLAIGLSVEAAELLELFLWTPDDTTSAQQFASIERLKEEIGDVLIYVVNLADRCDLDPIACALEKLETNKAKYPAHKVRGSARKYNDYPSP